MPTSKRLSGPRHLDQGKAGDSNHPGAIHWQHWETNGVPNSLGCYYGGDDSRTAIITYKCNLLLCPPYSGRDVTTCQMSLEGGDEVFVVSVYCDSLKKEVPCEVVKLLQENRGANFLICMDANAHSPMWGGGDETNPRGK